MKAKNVIIVLIVLALLLGISSASASDTNTTDDEKVCTAVDSVEIDDSDSNGDLLSCGRDDSGDVLLESDQDNIAENDKNDSDNEILELSNGNLKAGDGDLLGDGDDSFTALQNLIDSDTSGTVDLTHDYWYSSGDVTTGVTISKDLVINGNGYTLDAKGSARIFNITSGTVCLNNLSFVNGSNPGSGDYGDSAGFILVLGGTFSAVNCHFENGYAQAWGGAIQVSGSTVSAIIDKCSFINNSVGNGGGAINTDNLLLCYNSTFIGNTAGSTHKGGAIRPCANADIRNNAFIGSTSEANNGITQINSGTVTTEDNWRGSNNPTYSRGSILKAGYCSDSLSVDNITFHTVFYKDGDSSMAPVTLSWIRNITGINISGNTSSGVYNGCTVSSFNYTVDNQNLTVVNPYTFTVLQALINENTNGTLDLTHDYWHSSGDVTTGVTISKDLVINGNGYTLDATGSARIFNITIADNGLVRLFNLSLINANADNGSAITQNNCNNLVLANVTFINNTASGNGGAVYVNSGASLNADTVNFIDNTAVYKGGAICAENANLTLNNCLLDGNDVTEIKTSDDTGGAAIYARDSTVIISDSKITNNGNSNLNRTNNDLVNGVLNLIDSTATISDSVFENNTGIYGGEITVMGDSSTGSPKLTVTGSNFTANKAYNGAAIYTEINTNGNEIEFTIDDCLFTDNKVEGIGSSGYFAGGGAICISSGKGTVSNVTVKGSKATSAGAVYIDDSEVSITKSTFENNEAVEWGGVIYTVGSADVTIDESVFNNNKASYGIITTGLSSSATISANFTNNTDSGVGTVLVNGTGDVVVENSNFISNNQPDVNVYADTNVEIRDSTLNTTSYYCIVSYNGNLTLSNNEMTATYCPILLQQNAKIVSTVIANVSEGKTYNTHLGTVEINSTLTDDSGNLIYDFNFNYMHRNLSNFH